MPNTEESLLGEFPEVSYDAWRAEVERALKGGDFQKKLVTRTVEGIDVEPLYTEASWPGQRDPGGFAGAPPYRRGPEAQGRYGERWDMRPRYDNPDPSALKREIAADLARGARSLWLAFDADVRGGRAGAQVPHDGGTGVGCASAQQLAVLLDDVLLDAVTVSLDAGANALAVAACFANVVSHRGLTLDRTPAWFNADPLSALARDGRLPFSIDSARAQLVALAEFTARNAAGSRAVTVSVVPYHDAGAHAAQELAFALATGVTYLRWLTDAGLDLRSACSQIAFSVAVGSDFYMELAKLRALRQCWATVIAACGGGAEEQRCTIHATTSTRTKTQRDPWVNMLRETSEAFAAAIGGADIVTTAGFDRLLGVSDGFARRIAGNTQVILDEEAHVTRVADPGGGAWYIEALTDRLAQQGWQGLQAIEATGGMQNALCSGAIAKQIADVARERAALIAKRKQPITGISEYANVGEERVARTAPDWAALSAARAAALAVTAKDEAIAKPLVQARTAGRGVVEAAIAVAGQGANLGQLSCALASPGEAPAIEPLGLRRAAAPYEQLRDACDAYAAQHGGQPPRVFSCNIGPIPQHKARAQFAGGFFNAGGLSMIDNDGFATKEAAAEAYGASGAALCVICGSDDAYAEWVEALAPLLRARGCKRLVLAGRPAADAEARYRAAGVTDFIFMGCDAVQTLRALLTEIGVVS
jgi:methylmalonyl-CoA mutase